MTISLYAKVIKIDSDASEHHVEGFYNVPREWLVKNYVAKWYCVNPEMVKDEDIQYWMYESDYITCLDVYWDAHDSGVIVEENLE